MYFRFKAPSSHWKTFPFATRASGSAKTASPYLKIQLNHLFNVLVVVAGRCVEWNYAKELCSVNDEIMQGDLPICKRGEWQCGDGKYRGGLKYGSQVQ